MSRKGLLGTLLTATAAAAAIGGACYVFRDKIKESKLYEDLGIEDKLFTLREMLKSKEDDEEDFIDEDEYIFENLEPVDEDLNRNYVSLNTDTSPAVDTADTEPVEDTYAEDVTSEENDAEDIQEEEAADNISDEDYSLDNGDDADEESSEVPTISYIGEDTSHTDISEADVISEDIIEEKGETPSGYDMEGLSDVSEDPDVLIEQDLLDEAPYDI